ncbi:hypothetical protein [Iningainema tapete]|uniref:Uncharacterized protein n=1 Tax=Iningainema tapete BLCC-T55 TaxID=2748662 RepID=A0A8J7BZW5_9CYAN|nr:hypothetical protein [Iningainema tapete]MBD2778592.1 hypothetical protein [Iningainema tapete BLCC-T55]
MQYKLGCKFVSVSSLAVVIIGIGASSAEAQLTIQTTGTLSGTIQLPSFNPNFNQQTTRVDTDSTGTYYRKGVPIYKSNYVGVKTNPDGTLHYFVDFKGIPVVSFDGVLTSPVLSSGDLTPYTYQGKLPGTRFQAVVQDELALTKAFYTGTVTDPKTGLQYQGTFEVQGQGPRYSDANGGTSPTVFDFKSDLPGNPSVTSMIMTNTPLVKLTIKVPANATPISSGGNTTPTTPPVAGGGTTTPTTPPVAGGGTTTPIPPVAYSNSNPISPATPSSPSPQLPLSPTPPLPTSPTPSLPTSSTPTTESNMEFSNGSSLAVRIADDPSSLNVNICSQNIAKCRSRASTPKQAIGPRSRVLLR